MLQGVQRGHEAIRAHKSPRHASRRPARAHLRPPRQWRRRTRASGSRMRPRGARACPAALPAALPPPQKPMQSTCDSCACRRPCVLHIATDSPATSSASRLIARKQPHVLLSSKALTACGHAAQVCAPQYCLQPRRPHSQLPSRMIQAFPIQLYLNQSEMLNIGCPPARSTSAPDMRCTTMQVCQGPPSPAVPHLSGAMRRHEFWRQAFNGLCVCHLHAAA